MATAQTINRLFVLAEHLASDFSLIKGVNRANRDRQRQEVEVALKGLGNHKSIDETTKRLKDLEVDSYLPETVREKNALVSRPFSSN